MRFVTTRGASRRVGRADLSRRGRDAPAAAGRNFQIQKAAEGIRPPVSATFLGKIFNRHKRPPMLCPTCQTKFTTRAGGGRRQAYCSPKCRVAAHRARADGPQTALLRLPLPLSVPNVTDGVGRRVLMWVDDPLIGSGARPFVVVSLAGRVRLFNCAALVEIEVDRRVFDEHAESYESAPAALLAIIRRNIATAERHRLDYHRGAHEVERLLALLCEPQPEAEPLSLAA